MMPALLIRMSILEVWLLISAAAVRMDSKSSRRMGMKVAVVLGLIVLIWSITGWTFGRERASKKM